VREGRCTHSLRQCVHGIYTPHSAGRDYAIQIPVVVVFVTTVTVLPLTDISAHFW